MSLRAIRLTHGLNGALAGICSNCGGNLAPRPTGMAGPTDPCHAHVYRPPVSRMATTCTGAP